MIDQNHIVTISARARLMQSRFAECDGHIYRSAGPSRIIHWDRVIAIRFHIDPENIRHASWACTKCGKRIAKRFPRLTF